MCSSSISEGGRELGHQKISVDFMGWAQAIYEVGVTFSDLPLDFPCCSAGRAIGGVGSSISAVKVAATGSQGSQNQPESVASVGQAKFSIRNLLPRTFPSVRPLQLFSFNHHQSSFTAVPGPHPNSTQLPRAFHRTSTTLTHQPLLDRLITRTIHCNLAAYNKTTNTATKPTNSTANMARPKKSDAGEQKQIAPAPQQPPVPAQAFQQIAQPAIANVPVVPAVQVNQAGRSIDVNNFIRVRDSVRIPPMSRLIVLPPNVPYRLFTQNPAFSGQWHPPIVLSRPVKLDGGKLQRQHHHPASAPSSSIDSVGLANGCRPGPHQHQHPLPFPAQHLDIITKYMPRPTPQPLTSFVPPSHSPNLSTPIHSRDHLATSLLHLQL